MKKIALLLPDTVDKYTRNLIAALEKIKEAELLLIQLQPSLASHNIHEISYNLLWKAERKIVSRISEEVREFLIPDTTFHYTHPLITFNIVTDNSTGTISLKEHDYTYLKEKTLDLIIDCDTSRNLDYTTLSTCSKDGIVGIFYNHKIAFKEVCYRKDRIPFTIKNIVSKNSKLLFSGEIATFRLITETQARIMKESFPYLLQQITHYLIQNSFIPHPNATEYQFTHHIPTVFEQFNYLTKTASLYTELVIRRLFLKQYTRFSVAFAFTDQTQTFSTKVLSKGIQIQPPANHFYADPFVWTKKGRHVCFLEDYDYTKQIAWISAVEIFEDGHYEILGEVIREPFHLSFPYLFEYEDELYMIPESSAANSIRLYKCIDFPMQWEFQKELRSGIKAADTMLFAHEGKWWMLTNQTTENNADQAAQLFVYHNDSPLKSEGWQPHPLNPVVFSSDGGRNGGILLQKDKLPVRVGQRQRFNIYGAAFCLNQITQLTETHYKEERIAEIEPNFFPGLRATHHMHAHNGIIVYDFMKYRKLD